MQDPDLELMCDFDLGCQYHIAKVFFRSHRMRMASVIDHNRQVEVLLGYLRFSLELLDQMFCVKDERPSATAT